MPLSSIINLLEHFDQVTDLVNHPTDFGRINQLAGAANLSKAKSTNSGSMRFLAPNRATNQLNFDCLLCCHFETLAYTKSSSIVLPRLAATSDGVLSWDSASSVARTML